MRKDIKGRATESSRRHTFKSFTRRVDELHIDVAHRITHIAVDEEETTSYFLAGLEKWIDLNLTESFTDFVTTVEKISRSLAQVVYHQQAILDNLCAFISKQDVLALEPLLDLLVQFARDLGLDFEQYMPRVIEALIPLVTHPELEAIEWTFSAIAYLFKYLAKSLACNLVPTFDILAPLLGKVSQKPHIVRFAAESISFLVRRTKGDAQFNVLRHIISDVKVHHIDSYLEGVSYMLSEAIKGVEHSIHSRGVGLLSSLLHLYQHDDTSLQEGSEEERILSNILVSLTHHTTKETIPPLLDPILQLITSSISTPLQRDFGLRMLFVLSSVRKGSRIDSWVAVSDALLLALSVLRHSQFNLWNAIRLESVLFTYAPSDVLVAAHKRHLDIIQTAGLSFLSFCEIVGKQNIQVFKEFVLPYFHHAVNSAWSFQAALAIQRLHDVHGFTGLSNNAIFNGKLRLNHSVLHDIEVGLTNYEMRAEEQTATVRVYVQVLGCTAFSELSITCTLTALVHKVLAAGKIKQGNEHAPLVGIILGTLAALDSRTCDDNGDLGLLSKCLESEGLWKCTAFLEGLELYLKSYTACKSFDKDAVMNILYHNLGSSGHRRRMHSLNIIGQVQTSTSVATTESLQLCVLLESTPLVLDTARNLAMHTRKLASTYMALDPNIDQYAIRMVPKYLTGLMTTNYTSLWSYAAEALGQIAKRQPGIVWDLAQSWFRSKTGATGTNADETTDNSHQPVPSTSLSSYAPKTDSFRCFNHDELAANCRDSLEGLLRSDLTAHRLYRQSAYDSDERMSVSRRMQSVRIMSSIPEITEQHHQELVLALLHQFGNQQAEPEDDDSDEEGSNKWGQKERYDFLTLFTKFNNPAAFVQAGKVKEVFLSLLASGDSKIQNRAFETLMHWRDPAILRYEDNLHNFLSDARFRDEITTFLQKDAGDTSIEDAHRPYVMSYVARILYGRMVSRKNAGSQKSSLSSRRTTILGAIGAMNSEDLGIFCDLFLTPFHGRLLLDKSSTVYSMNPNSGPLSLKKQVGFCVMLGDIMEQIAGKMLAHLDGFLDALLYCFGNANDILGQQMDIDGNEVNVKIARNIRHSCYNSLALMFRYCRSFSWAAYMPLIYEICVNPRVAKLATENTQNPSGLLKLLANWATSTTTSPFLVMYNSEVLHRIFECLAERSIKEDVATCILTMVGNLCEQIKDPDCPIDTGIQSLLLSDKVDGFLDAMTVLLESQQNNADGKGLASSEFFNLEVSVLSEVSSFVQKGPSIQKLLDIVVPLLEKPRKIINDSTKEDLLNIVEKFLPLCDDFAQNTESFLNKYRVLSSLFTSCSTKRSRQTLCSIMHIFARSDPSLTPVAILLNDLNAWSSKRFDTPDFDKRLEAFAKINENDYKFLTVKAWRPIVHSMVFFVQDEEELAIRTNAAYTLRRYFEVVQQSSDDDRKALMGLLNSVLFAAIKKGMRHKNELIRQEYVSLLAFAIREATVWEEVADMQPLLVGGDEEANFFNNILHIQQHRRMRALRRLATISHTHHIQSQNIAQIILPLIEHFCFAPKEESHNLTAETIKTIGEVSTSLKFNQYSALLTRYISMLKPAELLQVTIARLIGSVVDGLVSSLTVQPTDIDPKNGSHDHSMTDDATERKQTATSTLCSSLPSSEKLTQALGNRFLPRLMQYLHSKDEETVSCRIPVAVTVVKLLVVLPPEKLVARLPGVLTDVCHILRSRSQDTRDMTRKTLGEIATLLGPKYFSYILSELKGALLRGYQLHVLGFTIHTILVKLEVEHGSLDYCLQALVDMLVDDIFGETGVEKEAEEYITKMKEMKSTKSYDSFEIIASKVELQNFSTILRPIRGLLQETSSLKVLRKVDEVCRRLSLGIMQNRGCASRDALLLCYNIYEQTTAGAKPAEVKELTLSERMRLESAKNFTIDLNARKGHSKNKFVSNAHRLLKFSLETLRSILQKNPSLQTAENLSAFVPIIGDSLLSGYEDVQISALRLLVQIIKVDLSSIDTGAKVFIDQAVQFIKNSHSTKSELCQASLKLISSILRERRSVCVGDTTLAYILLRIKADIEEPDRQGITFAILRSIMARKAMLPELYDVMDDVAIMMVTNQSQGPRDIARSAYYQFLLDYPQGKKRLNKQMSFLTKNLEYVHPSGRKSVLECLNLVVSNFGDSVLQEYISMLFVSMMMALLNDEEASCREMVAALLCRLYQRADKERLSLITKALKTWSENDEGELMLQRAAFQGLGLLFDTLPHRQEDVKFFLSKLTFVMDRVSSAMIAEEDEADVEDSSWQVLYYGLQTFSKLLIPVPATYISEKFAAIWTGIQGLLLFRHAWVRLVATRLLGTLFASKVAAQKQLTFGQGIKMTSMEIVTIARSLLIQLRSPFLSETLGIQIVKNLVFILRTFNEGKTVLPPRQDDIEHLVVEEETMTENPTCVEWLLKRAATLLQSDRDVKKDTHFLVRKLLLQFFAAAVSTLSKSDLESFATIIMRPIYKYTDAVAHTPIQSEIKDMAGEVLDMLKTTLGTTVFSNVYNQVRRGAIDMRQERRQKRTIEAVAYPERAATKKLKAGLKKKEKRKTVSDANKKRRLFRTG